jgi:hypothetical protein
VSIIHDILSSLWYTIGILLVALFLGLWQWFDRKSRDPNPTPVDHDFFRRQDRRRYIGVAVMVALAFFLVVVSSQALADYSKRLWLFIWAIVCVLIAALLVLALIDAVATQRYARRQLRSLAQERAKLMLDALGRPRTYRSSRRPPEKPGDAPEV